MVQESLDTVSEECRSAEKRLRKWNRTFLLLNVTIFVISVGLIALLISLENYWSFFYPYLLIINDIHGMGMIFAASTMAICSAFGFVIFCTQIRTHFIWYGLSLAMVLILDVKVIISGLVNDDIVHRYVETTLKRSMDQYHNNTLARSSIDNVQFSLMCCGVYNYSDWFIYSHSAIPFSCCPMTPASQTNISDKCDEESMWIFNDPCLEPLLKVPDIGLLLMYCIITILISMKVLGLLVAYKLERTLKYS